MGKKTRVFLDIAIGNVAGGRIVFELFSDITPRTAENFRGLCTGEYGLGRTTRKKLHYAGCSVFRSIKGFMIQSGDFQLNSGDGGESIYGGTFNDEDFTRRHTQAGILSMANKGRNTNGSQFFITLKRTPQLDGRHVAFGQVIDGMDVVRAMGAVPTDKDNAPRVPITILGSGEVGQRAINRADLHVQVGQAIAELVEEVAPISNRVPEAVKAKDVLAGKQSGSLMSGATLPQGQHGTEDDKDEVDDASTSALVHSEHERRLLNLRMRINQCRNANNKEVIEEQKRAADPEYSKQQAEKRHLRAQARQERAREGMGGAAAQAGVLPDGKEYLLDTAEAVEARDKKRKKGNPEAFGWDVFNQESLYRAHQKRLKTIGFDEEAYNRQKQQEEQDTPLFGGFGYVASEEQKSRLQEAMERVNEKKKEFSRRRAFVAEEDVTYINERNRHFNRKIQRDFGAYTEETRLNLERGTAL